MTKAAFCESNYLARIKLTQRPTLDLEGLTTIHNAQHLSIAFENFDVALGKGVNLDPDALISKLVNSKRGGYCFELNGLLLRALCHFGFTARALLGRVHLPGSTTGRGHLIILVELKNMNWIVDVGFGSQTPRAPIPLVLDKEVNIDQQVFKLSKHECYDTMLQVKVGGQWNNLYSFDLCHVCQGDIDYGNHFTSSHPNSSFVSSCVAYLPTATGGVSLLNRTLKQYENEQVKVTELVDDDYIAALKMNFGIELDAEFEMLKPLN